MAHLFLDLKNGISGDMFLAALCGLGLDLKPLQDLFVNAGLVKTLQASFITRHGFAGCRLEIEEEGNQPLRNLEDLLEVGKNLGLPDPIWGKCRQAFVRLAEAEAHVHGVPCDEVHFHEVGAVDTLVDVIGAFWGLHQLGITKVTANCLPWFSGTAQTCHGEIALPAPATLRLMQGKPVCPGEENWEIVTPTGALLLDCIVNSFEPAPGGIFLKNSLGYGSHPKGKALAAFLFKNFEASPQNLPNFWPELSPEGFSAAPALEANNISGAVEEKIWVLESHIDHLSGEDLGLVFEALLNEGALDVIYFPGLMKKNRPGGELRVLCLAQDLARVEKAFFAHTHTLGLRYREERRKVLPRGASAISCPEVCDESIAAKTYTLDGHTFSKPELEALKELAKRTGRTVATLKAMLYGDKQP